MKLVLMILLLSVAIPTSAFGLDVVGALSQATAWLNGPSIVLGIATVGPILETLLRIIPSSKAMGILLFLGSFFRAIASFCDAVDQAYEKIVPQNIKKS